MLCAFVYHTHAVNMSKIPYTFGT